MTTRLLIVDDQPLIRLGFRALLEQQPDLDVIGEAGDGAQAVTMTRTLRPDVVLMDVRMPTMDGIAATRLIAAWYGWSWALAASRACRSPRWRSSAAA